MEDIAKYTIRCLINVYRMDRKFYSLINEIASSSEN